VRYSTTEAYSGSQSLVIDYSKDGVNRYKGNFHRDTGDAIDRVYISFWVHTHSIITETPGQWKIWRLNVGVDAGTATNFYPNVWSVNGSREAQLFTLQSDSTWFCDGCEYEASASIYLSATETPGPEAVEDRWTRMEYWIDVGTEDVNDGTFVYKFHDPFNPTPIIKDIPKITFEGNLLIKKTGRVGDWDSFIMGRLGSDGLDIVTYWDDVFIQVGSWARVEVGNASTWAACTQRQTAIPSVWNANGQAITIAPIDDSGFDSEDTLYLFVVNDAGEASAGYLISEESTGVKVSGGRVSGGRVN